MIAMNVFVEAKLMNFLDRICRYTAMMQKPKLVLPKVGLVQVTLHPTQEHSYSRLLYSLAFRYPKFQEESLGVNNYGIYLEFGH